MEGNQSSDPEESWEGMVVIQGKQIIWEMGRRTGTAMEAEEEGKLLGRAEVPKRLCKMRVEALSLDFAWP